MHDAQITKRRRTQRHGIHTVHVPYTAGCQSDAGAAIRYRSHRGRTATGTEYIHTTNMERDAQREREQPLLCLPLTLPLPYSSVVRDYIRPEYDIRLLPHRDSHTYIYLRCAYYLLAPSIPLPRVEAVATATTRPWWPHTMDMAYRRGKGGKGEGSWGDGYKTGEVAAGFE